MALRSRLALLGVALVSLLASAELLARIAYSIPVLTRRLSDDDSATWRRRWVSAMAGDRQVMQVFDRYHPERGWETIPNYRGRHWDDRLVTTNSIGLRGSELLPEDTALTRIVVLGDSFTFGQEVADDETYSHLLGQQLPKTEVVNLGVHGYGHDQMLLLYDELALKLSPDIVILGFFRIDMSRNLLDFRGYAKPRFLPVGDSDLELVGVPVPKPEEILAAEKWRPKLLDLASLARIRIERASGRLTKRRHDITARLLERLTERFEASGTRGLFVYLPALPEIHRSSDQREGASFLASRCPKSPLVRCTNARQAFDRARDAGTEFRKDGHWGPAGHRIAARTIHEMLDETGWLAANR